MTHNDNHEASRWQHQAYLGLTRERLSTKQLRPLGDRVVVA